jgi:hypothetical protein
MNWFSKKNKHSNTLPQAPAHLELISIHIPKTAGTSFRLMLKQEYGEAGAVRLDIVDGNIRLENQTLDSLQLPPSVRAIHGHMCFKDVQSAFDLSSTPLITWLRHPVDRVLSNYFYLLDRMHDFIPKENHAVIPRMVRGLEEFVEAEPNQNRIAKFLDGANPNDFAFIGVVEQFEADIPRLADLMNWKNRSIPKVNETRTERPKVSEAMRAHIAALNARDMEWYAQALSISKSGKA